MNCWKTKYGYGGTSIDLCTTYYMSVGDDDSPYTFAECYRDGPNCLANYDSPLNCQWNQPTPPPPPPSSPACWPAVCSLPTLLVGSASVKFFVFPPSRSRLLSGALLRVRCTCARG